MKWKEHYKTLFKTQRKASYTICVNSAFIFFVPEPHECFKKNLTLCVGERGLKVLDNLWTNEARSLLFAMSTTPDCRTSSVDERVLKEALNNSFFFFLVTTSLDDTYKHLNCANLKVGNCYRQFLPIATNLSRVVVQYLITRMKVNPNLNFKPFEE